MSLPKREWKCTKNCSQGGNKILVPASSGARKVLVSAKFWCQQNSGTRKALVPEKLWCQQNSGTRKVAGIEELGVAG